MDKDETIRKIIRESLNKNNQFRKEFLLNGIMFYIQEAFKGDINLDFVIKKIENFIPKRLFNEVDMIMVGEYDFLTKRSLDALYNEGAIYLSPNIYSEKEIIENIVHELAHSLEEPNVLLIYGDSLLRREFLVKRELLKRVLENKGFDISKYDFEETEYDIEFDKFLYEEVGYINLRVLTSSFVFRPYSLTSLREYWASGFEDYYLSEKVETLKELSPVLYQKIIEIDEVYEV